jgi:two-component system nitrogen regulation response regulator GlnG
LPPLVDREVDWERLLAFVLEQAATGPFLRALLDEHASHTGSAVRRIRVVAGTSLPEPESGTLIVLFPDRAVRALSAHGWPGNLREFAMVVENSVTFALSELASVPPGERPDVVQVRPKLVRDLLLSEGGPAPRGSTAAGDGWRHTVAVQPHDTLNKVAVDVERQYFVALWREARGDFARMAEVLLGSPEHARKVQLRFNQLGLKVRDLKEGG